MKIERTVDAIFKELMATVNQLDALGRAISQNILIETLPPDMTAIAGLFSLVSKLTGELYEDLDSLRELVDPELVEVTLTEPKDREVFSMPHSLASVGGV